MNEIGFLGPAVVACTLVVTMPLLWHASRWHQASSASICCCPSGAPFLYCCVHSPPFLPTPCLQAPITRLPTALIAQMLSHVPQQQRLQVCALVHTTWAAAAAAATTDMTATINSDEQQASVDAWTRQHSSQLVSLSVSSPVRTLADSRCAFYVCEMEFPVAQLVQLSRLHFSGVDLIMTATSPYTASGVGCWHQVSTGPPPLPRLASVRLQSCAFSDAGSLMQLAIATGITRLHLDQVRLTGGHSTSGNPPPSHLSHNPSLQLAVLAYQSRAADDNQHLGQTLGALLQCLTQLQHLALQTYPFATLALALEHAPGSLQELVVTGQRTESDPAGQSCLPARLSHLTSLSRLKLESADYHPAALADLPQLQFLDCEWCVALGGLHGSAGLAGVGVAASAAPATLLGAVARLTRLSSLSLCACGCEDTGFASEPPEQFAVLTACTGLKRLVLVQQDLHMLPPAGAGFIQHMFPPGRQLQALACIKLEVMEWDGFMPEFGFMTTSELRCLITACPALQVFGIANALQEAAAVPELLRLPQCCKDLSVGGMAFADAAAPVLVQLTQLTCLRWCGSPDLTDPGLEQLTARRGLQVLILSDLENVSEGLFPREQPWAVLSFGSVESPGTVSAAP